MSEISFTQFPINFNVPGVYVEYSNRRNQAATPVLPQKILVVGQMLASGIATVGVPVLATSADLAGQLAGRGSQLHQMAIAALAGNYGVPVWLMPLEDDEDGTKSTRTLTFTGTPTAAGTVFVYVGGRRYTANIAASATVATIATAVAAAINVDELRHVDATAALGVVTLTARHAGIDAGQISCLLNRYSDERLPAGLTAAIGDLTAGTGNPDLTDAIAAIQNIWYPTLVLGVADTANLTAVRAELERRNGPVAQIEGVAFIGVDDTVQNALTFAAAQNSPFICAVDGADYLTPKWVVAAAAAGVQATLAQNDPALPEQQQEMPTLVAKPESMRRLVPERNQLINGGVSTSYTEESGVVRAEYFVTTYRKNAQGVEDLSRFAVCHTRIWAQTRFGLRVWFGNKFPQAKLGQNGSIGPRVVTPNQIKSEAVSFYRTYMDQGWFEGGAAFEQFKREAFAEINATNKNRADLYFPPDFMNQLRVVGVLVEPVG